MSPPIVPLAVDRSRCVLCGGPNACVMERRARGETVDDPCWCVSRSFPAEITARADARDGGASCICQACVDAGAAPVPEDR
ncbi:MAG: cysteine-rich CWC family protein [Myxococcota bacterium]